MLHTAAARFLGSSSSFLAPLLARRVLSAHLVSQARLLTVSSTASVVSSSARVSVKAYYIGRSILFKELYDAHPGRKVLRQDCAILYGPFLTDVSDELEAANRSTRSTPGLNREVDVTFATASSSGDDPPPREADWQLDSTPARISARAPSSTQTEHCLHGYELDLGPQQQEGVGGGVADAEQPPAAQAAPTATPLRQQHADARWLHALQAAASPQGGVLVATRFGAAVFLAVPEEDHWPIIRVLLPGVTLQPVPFSVITDTGRTWKNEAEELQVKVQPHMQRYVEKGEDCLLLQRLDVASVHVIATCIGQSIALQYHMWMLNNMMSQFHALRTKALQQQQGTERQASAVSLLDVLRSVRLLGPAASTHDLARLVAGLNKLRIEMAVGLQLLEYHPMAWQHDRYDQLWAVLRREFELEDMHALLNKKLKAVAEEAAYDMDESFQSRYQRLVWVVVGLLLFGNMVDVWDLFGRVRAALGAPPHA